MILLLDNYDSFTYNLRQALAALGAEVLVRRNDALRVEDILALGPRALVISPGPGRPEEAGITLEAIRALRGRIPILGVCLGHQALAQALGGRVVPALRPLHGKASAVRHEGRGLFAGLPDPLLAARYHSLAVEPASLPGALRVTARDEDATIMALEDPAGRLWGVQFHPESILTPCGPDLLRNFLAAVQ